MIIDASRLASRWRARKNVRTAVFLGAGASAAFGYPVTGGLLPQIVQSLKDNDFLAALSGDAPSRGRLNRKLLSEYLHELMPGKSLRRKNLPLVTALLSLLDHSLATGQSLLPARSTAQTREARRLLERGILEVIGDDEWFNATEEAELGRFCGLLTDLRSHAAPPRQDASSLAIITTNYDMAADVAAFTCAGIETYPDDNYREDQIAQHIDFGFDWLHPLDDEVTLLPRPAKPRLSLLKLHGSTNWLRCPLCDNLYINPWGPIWEQAYKTKTSRQNRCHCSYTRLEAQIVSPSYVREMRQANLLSVWKAALDALRGAQRWLIIGYSFPDEDLGVRALFTRAYGSRESVPEIAVIQRDRDAYRRYEAFFAPETLAYCPAGLSAFLGAWRSKPRAAIRS